jgi:cytoskeletal protein CcmA (bactofilin family)
MSTAAHIGSSIHIKGHVTAQEPLTIAGRVDGTIAVDGHSVTIAAGGQVHATIVAHEIVVGGEVHGQLDATSRIVVRETATVVGDMTAPNVSLADGAVVTGKVQTGERKQVALSLAS